MSIYLDYNATAVVRPEAAAAVAQAMALGGNPSSVHAAGRAARVRVEDARAEVAALVGVTFAGSLLIYEAVRRVPAMRPLWGLRPVVG